MAKLRVMWMAPESLSDGHFSEKSDVVGIFCLCTGQDQHYSKTVVVWGHNVGGVQWG